MSEVLQETGNSVSKQQAYREKIKKNIVRNGKVQIVLSVAIFALGVALGYISKIRAGPVPGVSSGYDQFVAVYPWYGVGVWSSVTTFISSLRTLCAGCMKGTGGIIHVQIVFAAIAILPQLVSCVMSSYIAYYNHWYYIDTLYQMLMILLALLEFFAICTMINSILYSAKISTCRVDQTLADQIMVPHTNQVCLREETVLNGEMRNNEMTSSNTPQAQI